MTPNTWLLRGLSLQRGSAGAAAAGFGRPLVQICSDIGKCGSGQNLGGEAGAVGGTYGAAFKETMWKKLMIRRTPEGSRQIRTAGFKRYNTKPSFSFSHCITYFWILRWSLIRDNRFQSANISVFENIGQTVPTFKILCQDTWASVLVRAVLVTILKTGLEETSE